MLSRRRDRYAVSLLSNMLGVAGQPLSVTAAGSPRMNASRDPRGISICLPHRIACNRFVFTNSDT